MIVKGIQRLSMVDYPGLIATTLFTPGCNMRCPFCHNSSLVVGDDQHSFIDLDDLFAFLESRRKKIDAVCLSGGEPLLQEGVTDFLLQIKKMGFKTKLDTNGTRPDALLRVLEAGAADYVAMDLKNSPERYGQTVGVAHFDLSPVLKSIDLLMEGKTPYEFRTTVTKTFHDLSALKEAGALIKGAESWYLQSFKAGETVLDPTVTGYEPDELKAFLPHLIGYAKRVSLRGI